METTEMLRITDTGAGQFELTGRLVAGWVDELARVVERDADRVRCVDLRDVTYVDRRGVSLLRRLASSGVVFSNASVFVSALVWGDDDDRSC
jgi:hypothetical protein